jgi:hypothetical protein
MYFHCAHYRCKKLPGEILMKSITLFCILAIAVFGSAAANPPAAVTGQLLTPYYAIQKSLVSDSMNGVAAAAAEIAKIGKQASTTQQAGKPELLALSECAAKFSAADLKAGRAVFGDLSDKIIAFIKASNSAKNPPYQYYCPMVKKNWLQPDKGGARNPYYGSSMPTCGELVP